MFDKALPFGRMGRRVNLSHLSKDECERILSVIQKDFDLRLKEQERLSKIEEELNEAASQRNVLAKRKEFNEKCCILCCSTFNLLFNKKFQCHDCHFSVCRNCSSWESNDKVWLCRVCEQQRLLYVQSCQWFYSHIKERFKHFGSAKVLESLYNKKKESADSENDSGYGPSADGRPSRALLSIFSNHLHCGDSGDSMSVIGSQESQQDDESDLAEIRLHIETVVESLIGDKLDKAHVDRPYFHPKYNQLFNTYHSALAEAISRLSDALQVSIQNKNTEQKITPTTAHTTLKIVISETMDSALDLPELKTTDDYSEQHISSQTSSGDSSTDAFPSYEDLLASAIINKVVEKTQEKYHKDSSLVPHSQTEFPHQTQSLPMPQKDLVDVGVQSDICDDEINSDAYSEKSDHLPFIAKDIQGPLECVQVEEIEEVTRETYTDSDDDFGSKLSLLSGDQLGVDELPFNSRVISKSDSLTDLSFSYNLEQAPNYRVPFPELGLDLVDQPQNIDDDSGNDQDIMVCPTSVSNWQDNWLFRKRKLPLYSSLRYQLAGNYNNPPYMLIPNPKSDIQVQIGSRDIDDVSELSENLSFGSLEFSSSENEATSSQKLNENNLQQILSETVADFGLIKDHQNIHNVDEYIVKNSDIHIPHLVPKPQNEHQKQLRNENISLQLPVPVYKSKSCRIQNSHDPSFLTVPEDINIHSGKVARCVSEVKGSKPLEVAWFQSNHHLQKGGRFNIYTAHKKFILEIYSTTPKDSGAYSCVVYNHLGEQWVDFSIKIKASSRANTSPEFVIPLRVLAADKGQVARISCTVSGYPEPQLLMLHKGYEIVTNNKFILENMGYGEWLLEIANVDSMDEGQYQAVAHNELGKASSSAALVIGCVTKDIENENKSHQHKNGRIDATLIIKSSKAKDKRYKKQVLQQDQPEHLEPDIPQNKDLYTPPRPGTIADREHKKWLNAIPISNNPYSAANLSKRKEKKILSSAPNERHLTYEEFHNELLEKDISDNLLLTHCGVNKVDCGLKNIDASRYKRDYYINAINDNSSSKRTWEVIPSPYSAPLCLDSTDFHDNFESEEALNSLEEKVYISAGKVFTLEDHVRRLEREVQLLTPEANEEGIANLESQVAETAVQVANSDQQVTLVEEEVMQLQKALISAKIKDKESFVSSEEDCPSLPSVKDLALKFTITPPPSANFVKSSKTLVPEKPVILIEKSSENVQSIKKLSSQVNSNNIKVHSLTARSLPKEFRETAQMNLPRPMNRTVSLLPEANPSPLHKQKYKLLEGDNIYPMPTYPNASISGPADFGYGYTSDESTTSTSSLPRTKTRKHVSQSILERASYWEKRAEQGLLSDASVSEDFPSMETSPDS